MAEVNEWLNTKGLALHNWIDAQLDDLMQWLQIVYCLWFQQNNNVLTGK